MRKILTVTVILLTLAALASGCTLAGNKPKGLPQGDLAYDRIDTAAASFAALNQGDFAQWYEAQQRIEGVHTFASGSDRYILIAAGEKPSGGYYLENIRLTDGQDKITAAAALHRPAPGEAVTAALTYPHALLRLAADPRPVEGSVENNTAAAIRTDSGRYSGQIDSNSIEIKISGVPGSLAARAFALDEAVKARFTAFALEPGDTIRFQYQEREGAQPLIVAVEKLP